MRMLCLAAVAAACGLCRAEGGDVVRAAMERRPKVVAQRLVEGVVTTEFSDGTTVERPLRKIAQPPEVHARIKMLMARDRIARAALDAAEIPADATEEAKAAVLEEVAASAAKKGSAFSNALKAAGLLAAGAAGGAAIGKPKKKES